jgi:hypothetical protein
MTAVSSPTSSADGAGPELSRNFLNDLRHNIQRHRLTLAAAPLPLRRPSADCIGHGLGLFLA